MPAAATPAAASSATEASAAKASSPLGKALAWVLRLAGIAFALSTAFTIRLVAIRDYGRIIHEFDPWFNFRATQYLSRHGLTEFFHWFDHESWYPLGRPVGTTIYPGMQMVAVAIHRTLGFLDEALGGAGLDGDEPVKGSDAIVAMSLNDVCCFMPCWFGVLATALVGLLTYECSRSANAAVAASIIMSMVPAHIMRSVGGGFDNESVAVSAMVLTFWLWTRALRSDSSWPIGILAGLAYVFMVAAWGGYVFVINMVGIHAVALVFLGRYSNKLHRAYTLLYLVGTAGAVQVPVVGWAPLKSLEQLGPFGVFGLLQILAFCDHLRIKNDLTNMETQKLRFKVIALVGAAAAVVAAVLAPTGYFGPLSARVRGLFVRHTRTGNPLVDSVAEHQPASANAYFQYLHLMCYVAPIGLVMTFFKQSDARFFLTLYGLVAYFFSAKMVRLIILMGAISSALGGIAIGGGIDWSLRQLFGDGKSAATEEDSAAATAAATAASPKKAKKGKAKGPVESKEINKFLEWFDEFYNREPVKIFRKAGALAFFVGLLIFGGQFSTYCHRMSEALSNPSIVYKATLQNGQPVIVDDYREAYHWLRDNTPQDSRVMAWWDYGYQIAGIANRTTIADGNTWNHEHLALLGRCLTSPEKEAHRIIRHLADYMLVWAGGGGDDLAKSPHMARIGTSVYKNICPGDPSCSQYGFVDRQGTPTPMMARSLLYKLHGHQMKAGVFVDPDRFKHVFTSKYGKVRIFKVLKVSETSKKWVADPANRICDAPGSWFCRGQYPPAIAKVLKEKKNFKQLEDFNVRDDDEEENSDAEDEEEEEEEEDAEPDAEPEPEATPAPVNPGDVWENTAETTRLWNLINDDDTESLQMWLDAEPRVALLRAADGRGPLYWAYEYGRTDAIKALIAAGADPDAVDGSGKKPADMKQA